jgi:hypothetical protein
MRLFPLALCLAGALLLLDGQHAAAQTRDPVEPRFGLELLTSGVDAAQAEDAGIGTRAWGAQFAGGVTILRVLNLSADAGGLGMADNAQFTQPTTEGDKSSSVTGGLASLAVGLQTPSFRLEAGKPAALSVGVSAGQAWLSARRSIERCSACRREDIEIRAGSFWEPGAWLDMGPWGISARYRVYGGDSTLRDALMIGYYSTMGRGRKAQTVEPADDPR